MCLYIIYVCAVLIAARKWGWISVKKERQKTIHKQREWPKEWKRHEMSHISIWDRRRDLFKLSESSFLSDDCIQCFLPLFWILNDPCRKYSPLVRVLIWDRGRQEGGMFSFWFLLVFYNTLLCACLICTLQSNHFGQSAGRLGNHVSGRRTLPCRGGERNDRRECDKSRRLP